MKFSESPYAGKEISEWQDITLKLIEDSPFTLDLIREIAIESWGVLWKTRIGYGDSSIRFVELEVPAPVVGYFFEKLFVMVLKKTNPTSWRRAQTKDEKDIVYIPNPNYSVEMKASGQLGTKIYGNRSYGQKVQNESQVKKSKSGYYITVNFFGNQLNLLRFGWIDHDDWKPQKSPTGQMAGLSEEIYEHKLITVKGDYLLDASIQLLEGIGQKASNQLAKMNIFSIRDLRNSKSKHPLVAKFHNIALKYPN